MVKYLGRAFSVLVSVFLTVCSMDMLVGQDSSVFNGYGFRISTPSIVDPFQQEIYFGMYRDTLASPFGLLNVSLGQIKTTITSVY